MKGMLLSALLALPSVPARAGELDLEVPDVGPTRAVFAQDPRPAGAISTTVLKTEVNGTDVLARSVVMQGPGGDRSEKTLILIGHKPQQWRAGRWNARTYKGKDGAMRYQVYIPKGYDAFHKILRYPLIVELHGEDKRGQDGRSQIDLPGPRAWVRNQLLFPAIVLAPQTPDDWAPGKFGDTKVGPRLRQVLAIIEQLNEELSIDERRVYGSGTSIGAAGIVTLAQNAPFLFAAVLPVAGSGNVGAVRPMKLIPYWGHHGKDDKASPEAVHAEFVKNLRDVGGLPFYSAYAGAGHGVAEKVYSNPAVVSWLFLQYKLIR